MAFYREAALEASARNNRKNQTCSSPTSLRFSGQHHMVRCKVYKNDNLCSLSIIFSNEKKKNVNRELTRRDTTNGETIKQFSCRNLED